MLEESAVEKTTPKDYTGFWVVVLASFLALALSGAPSPLYYCTKESGALVLERSRLFMPFMPQEL